MIVETIENKYWFALYTKPRHEFKAAAHFNIVSIDYYLPTYFDKRQWKDRKKKVEAPLFNGYIFIYATEKERILSLKCKSIIKTICFQGKPSIIPDSEIENIKLMLSNQPELFITDYIEKGNKVKIVSGPFEGVYGTVKNINSEEWLFVSVEILNRSVSVKLTRDCVYKVIE